MSEINVLAVVVAVVVAAVAAVLSAGVYYTVFAARLERAGGAPADAEQPPWIIPLELVRSLVVAAVVAGLVVNLDVVDATGAVLLGVVLWVGFPVVLLAGSVIHEKVPVAVATIHAGDWLAKLLLVTLVVTLWPGVS